MTQTFSETFGEWVAQRRSQDIGSRGDFVAHAHSILPTSHPLYRRISLSWIRHIEDKKRKSFDKITIVTLCTLLRATEIETADFLIAAGFTPLLDSGSE